MSGREAQLHQAVANYLKVHYPQVIFHTDFAAGMKMPIWLAARNKKLQSGRGFPDIFIAYPNKSFHGCFIELKDANIYLKDGSLSKEKHLQEQNDMLAILRDYGYRAEFAVGFAEATKMIDQYLG